MKRIIAGPRAVIEALRSDASKVAVIYLAAAGAGRGALKEIARQAQKKGVSCQERDGAELDGFCGGSRHQGVVAVAGEYGYLQPDALLPEGRPYPLIIALDQITDPHNFGAIVRSAVALGADGIITLRDRASPVTPAVVRASAGATEHARIARVTNLARALRQLRERGLQVVGLDAAAPRQLRSLSFGPGGRALVVGSEGRGLRRLVRENCDTLARIELPGPIASLNASVAAAIALYESVRQRRATEPIKTAPRIAAALIIGDEILTGKVQESNLGFLAKELFDLGISLRRVVVCPDEIDAIVEDLNALRKSHDLVFTSGGMGPTHDDVTVAAAARAFGRPVVRSAEIEKLLRDFYASRITEAHLRMADIPEGARLLCNDEVRWPTINIENVFLLPGVPELFRMKFTALREILGAGACFTTVAVYTRCEESEIAPLLDRIVARHSEVKIGSYPQWRNDEYRVKITFDGCDSATVQRARDEFVQNLPADKLVKLKD